MNALSQAEIQKLCRYWRNTLADEDLMGLDAIESPVCTTMDIVRSGTIAEPSVKLLQEAWNEYKSRASRDQTAADLVDSYKGAVPVIISARGFAPRHEHGKMVGDKGSGRAYYTLYIPAILAPSGSLSFAADTLPWIGREFLRPNEDADVDTPMVGELDAFDGWLTDKPLVTASWKDVIHWCDGLWQRVAGERVPDGFVALEDLRIDVAKSVKNAGRYLGQLYDALRTEEKMPNLLGRLCEGSVDRLEISADLRRRQLAAPRGTMSTAHGLADSQADAIAAYTVLKPGEILAVNGPPGTGKTTLLQSIIATEVVARAMQGGDPAVIVGTSTNNQAVVNINDSLNGILRQNPAAALFPWARRWVPDAETYGLYLPAGDDKANAALKKGYAVAVKNGSEWTEFPEREKDPTYLADARSQWLKAYQDTYDCGTQTVEAGLERLQADLAHVVEEAQHIRRVVERYCAIDQWWHATAGDMPSRIFIAAKDTALSAAVDQATETYRVAEAAAAEATTAREAAASEAADAARAAAHVIIEHQEHLRWLTGIKARVSEAVAPRGWLEILAEIIPLARGVFVHKRIARLCTLAAQDPPIGNLFAKELCSNDPAAWMSRANQVMQDAAAELTRLRDTEAAAALRRREEIARADRKLAASVESREAVARNVAKARRCRETRLAWLEAKARRLSVRTTELQDAYDALRRCAISEFAVADAKHRAIPEVPAVADFDWLLDVTWRHMAFQKAMRYWEGRWIIAAQAVQEGQVNTKSGRSGTEARFRRWCMLTPCLVITLHSLPKHFRFSSMGNAAAWISNFMFDFIDLLIMDEAGQVGPHVGAAAFALASRATVVGDIYQIEPVCRVSRGADYANSMRAGLRGMWTDGDPVRPHIVSEPSDGSPQGSVMRLAQRATTAVSPGTEKEPGVFLAEHRRCRSEIVEYCNRLIYNGRLLPLSPPRDKKPPVSPMAWAHVQGVAKKVGGSNANPLEAQAIAEWIAGNAEAWCQHYGKPIDEVVAVVTPFRPQVKLIRMALGKRYANVIVGTVHSLQGAEKPIVVFSPTYSSDTARGMFFDRKPNMLNVTVSRAKDSFVVIGDMRLFRRRGRSPSAVLGDMLFAQEENELRDVDGNHRFTRELLVSGERISTLDRHREVLREALIHARAGQMVLIASPWITMKAIEDEGLAALIADAVQCRGVRVRIVVDRELSVSNPKHRAAEAVAAMRKAGATVSAVAKMHNKTLIAGPSEIIEGSFNWLSANRQRYDEYIRHETSWRISGISATDTVQSALKEFDELCKIVDVGLALPSANVA
jgi:hypothetical protein